MKTEVALNDALNTFGTADKINDVNTNLELALTIILDEKKSRRKQLRSTLKMERSTLLLNCRFKSRLRPSEVYKLPPMNSKEEFNGMAPTVEVVAQEAPETHLKN